MPFAPNFIPLVTSQWSLIFPFHAWYIAGRLIYLLPCLCHCSGPSITFNSFLQIPWQGPGPCLPLFWTWNLSSPVLLKSFFSASIMLLWAPYHKGPVNHLSSMQPATVAATCPTIDTGLSPFCQLSVLDLTLVLSPLLRFPRGLSFPVNSLLVHLSAPALPFTHRSRFDIFRKFTLINFANFPAYVIIPEPSIP